MYVNQNEASGSIDSGYIVICALSVALFNLQFCHSLQTEGVSVQHRIKI